MANLTFADYISTTLAYAGENRDNASSNRLFRIDDVKRAINKGRAKMLRGIGLSAYRNQTVVDATAGEITPPADFFKSALLRFTPSTGTTRRLEPTTQAHLDKTNPSWADRTGDPTHFLWNLTTDGLRVRLWPEPTATVTDGLTWDYTAVLDDLEDDADECPIMNLFPEFQMTTLQSGALSILYLLEGGEGDDQFVKHAGIHERDINGIRSLINSLFEGRDFISGRN